MHVGDLGRPVVAAKSDWAPAQDWTGFTPASNDAEARAQLRSTINRQTKGGLILEYVTKSLPQPNAGSRPLSPEERADHAERAGRLTAIHLISSSAIDARAFLSPEAYKDMQDRWDERGDRVRWSEAFPILQSWRLAGFPDAKAVFGESAYQRIFRRQDRTLRPLGDDERVALAGLPIEPLDLPADGPAARHYQRMAAIENEVQGRRPEAAAPDDMGLMEDYRAIEGASKEARVKLAQRDRYLVKLVKASRPLVCQACGYDPIKRGATRGQARALIEAHHLLPIQAGMRLSRPSDIMLLCPTCHRETHQGLSIVGGKKAAQPLA